MGGSSSLHVVCDDASKSLSLHGVGVYFRACTNEELSTGSVKILSRGRIVLGYVISIEIYVIA